MIKHKKIQAGLIILILFSVAVPAIAIVCGQRAGSGCGQVGLNAPGGYLGPVPSCNLCACFCGWAECCVPPGVGGRHLSYLWDGKTCGCPTGGMGKIAQSLQSMLPTTQFPNTPEGLQQFAQQWQDKVTWQWGGGYVVNADGTLNASCGGWTQFAYQQQNNGFDIGGTTAGQYAQGISMPMDQVPPGSIVTFQGPTGAGHGGMYVGDGWMMHNNSWTGGVVYDRIETFYNYYGDQTQVHVIVPRSK